MKENFVIEYSDVVLFMKQKQRRKEKERKRQNKEAKQKQRRKTGKKGKKDKKKRETEKEKLKKGEPQKTKEKQRETLKNKQKFPFLGGNKFFILQSKERKGTTTNQKKQKIVNEEGLGPSEVALWATSPDIAYIDICREQCPQKGITLSACKASQ